MRSHDNEEPRALQQRVAPHSPQLEKARAQQRRPNTDKNLKNKTKQNKMIQWKLQNLRESFTDDSQFELGPPLLCPL